MLICLLFMNTKCWEVYSKFLKKFDTGFTNISYQHNNKNSSKQNTNKIIQSFNQDLKHVRRLLTGAV